MKKIISLLLVALMFVTAVPLTASAGVAQDVKCALGNHAAYREEVVTAATCGTVGVARVYCSNCNELLETKVIPATGVHTPENVVAVAPNCITTGLTAGTKCTVCKDILSGCETIPATGHINTEIIKGTLPDCTLTGIKDAIKCKDCKRWIQEQVEIPALGHDMILVSDKSVPATCKEEGTNFYDCSRCDATSTEVTPKVEHTLDSTKWVVYQNATCTKEGVKVQVCRVCKETIKETIPIATHVAGEWNVIIAANCGTIGIARVYCLNCNEILETKIIQATGAHTSVNVSAVAATCLKTGLTAGTMCSVCGDILTGCDEIKALGHDVQDVPAIAATCESTGLTTGRKCIRLGCDYVITAQATTAKLGHQWKQTAKVDATCYVEGYIEKTCQRQGCGDVERTPIPEAHEFSAFKTTKAPTCTVDGLMEKTCSKCKGVIEEPIPKLGHTEKVVTEVAATCEKEGKKAGKVCSVCEVVITGCETIPAKGHTYQSDWQTIIAPTCTETGVSIKICANCFNIQTNTLAVILHSDYDADYKCDMCSLDMTPPQPEEPADPSENCECSCHKSGMANFFFKIKLFFWKIFKKNQICEGCGAYHY